MKIPIENIYYLLSYALDFMPDKELVEVNRDDFKSMLDLLARILVNGTKDLIKHGLDRNYITDSDTLVGIRGKINVAHTIKKNLCITGRVHCEFDEFHRNVIHNQIFKSILYQLLRTDTLNQELHDEIRSIYPLLDQIDFIKIEPNDFNKVKLHRNNRIYQLLMNICRLIYENSTINERSGKYNFHSFAESDQKMGDLFESFVRKFYMKEQDIYHVSRKNINWDVNPIGESSIDILPIMQTDISLQSDNRKIIIETKFYSEIFTKRREVEKIRSGHLYQLCSYLKNVSAEGGLSKNCEGILLYAENDKSFSEQFQLGDHKLTIRTINLNQSWRNIHDDLIKVLS